jgi:fructokinase
MRHGGIEAGGTKWVCAIGEQADRLLQVETFPTTTPDETLARAADFFTGHGGVDALGIGCFGPVDLHGGSPTWGYITSTPKPGWAHTDVAGPLGAALDVPVAFDTDVNAAAVGEWRWGAAAGLETFSYVTIGTGIGGGMFVNGRPLHGLAHPELGHMLVPHDRQRDPFDGACPYHGDCLEGLASGEAIRRRWGRPAEELDDPETWALEAEYVALGLVNLICALSPELIVIGGGVAHQPQLLPLVRVRLADLVAGYLDVPELVAPQLGDRAGVVGAVELARSL